MIKNPKNPLPRRHTDKASVSTIREVFDYIKHYKKKTFVLKIEDCLLTSPLLPLLMKDIIQLHDIGVRIIIVTGTRHTIDKHIEQAGLKTVFIKGVRVTPASAIPHVKLAAMEVVETMISHLAAGGANGIMGNWIRARSMGVRDGVDYQCTGQVEKIRSDIIEKLLDQQFIPLMYNIGFNTTGTCYNLNSTLIARQLCLDIDVEKMFFIGRKEGIASGEIIIPTDTQVHPNGNIISNLDINHVNYILQQNPTQLCFEDREILEISKTIISKPGGVKRVHIINGNREGSLLQEVFSSVGGGTMIYGNRYAHIRKAQPDDVPEIMNLIDGYIKKGNLVMRTDRDIRKSIFQYCIYEVDCAVYGCGALYETGNGWGEIGAIAVNPSYKSRGVGRGIMQYLIDVATRKGLKHLFLMTTQAADWFFEFGFIHGSPKDLPEKKRATYNIQRNSRVLTLDIEQA